MYLGVPILKHTWVHHDPANTPIPMDGASTARMVIMAFLLKFEIAAEGTAFAET